MTQSALVCRISVMVMVTEHSPCGRQYCDDQHNKNENPPDSIRIEHERGAWPALRTGYSLAYTRRHLLYVPLVLIGQLSKFASRQAVRERVRLITSAILVRTFFGQPMAS
jgi:hypothetical protein